MRASLIARGIRGIFPLIRTLAPQAISPPFALPALRGLRLAIDATLLVQRLHFADDPHASRHVIGFYRLITSLRQHEVIPLMVFDHPQKRLALKDREQIKRRHKRELDRIRSKLEHQRRGRLLELQAHLDALSQLQEEERRQVGELLEEWLLQSKQVISSDTLSPSTPKDPSPPPPTLPATPSRPEKVAHSMHTNWLQLEESLRSGGSSQSKGQRLLAEAEKQVYQTIATQLMSGEAPAPLPPTTASDILVDPTSDATPHPLSSLTAMHHSLTKTYDRATSPLSASIYQDCATLSSLMGVPVFWTGDGTRTGGGRIHEAEAYAASLVQSGFADLVASEDSDVLLYEAPLLRGLMGSVRSPGVLSREGARGKLEVVCGTRARLGLFPLSELASQPGAHEATKDAETYDRTTRSLMLDFALLCGTDFNRTIPGIGPKTALRLLKEHGSISTILRKEKKFAPPDGLSVREYETELRHARMVFLQPPKVRAAARSILGSAAAEVAQQSAAKSVERVLFAGEATSETQHGETARVNDVQASDGAGSVDSAYCTAEPAIDLENDVSTSTDTITPNDTATSISSTEVNYDRQAVRDFLRLHDVFRSPSSSSSVSEWALEPFDSSPSQEQDWRDLLDLELGLTSSSDFASILEQESNAELDGKAQVLSVATLGADFFGEHQAVACWNPHMEQQVREETTARCPQPTS
ncbi:related to RAD27-5' to 3' exonuclease [Sporisorium scitamineum]|uniref:Related to RAD27-5' to 3' exonuclease n=1 Tax=Sporisorium scitamineum TaxID=49012 RepID=A0A0F7RYH1_9BASI|nr:hypothetical protein [Sporisorium scitamineum]CDU22248.1 related to RAD27-5' to 3' exonuclease [Sporisorium scitamineum]